MYELTHAELDAVAAGQQTQHGRGLVVVGAQVGDITVENVLNNNAVLNNVTVPIGIAVAVLSGATGVLQRL